MEKYILTIDQGTTSTRAILVDKNGRVVNMSQEEVVCSFPHSGWVETDALNIWVSVINVVNELLVKCPGKVFIIATSQLNPYGLRSNFKNIDLSKITNLLCINLPASLPTLSL